MNVYLLLTIEESVDYFEDVLDLQNCSYHITVKTNSYKKHHLTVGFQEMHRRRILVLCHSDLLILVLSSANQTENKSHSFRQLIQYFLTGVVNNGPEYNLAT